MDFEEYRRRVIGCYTGKAVGGTLGMPFEGNLNTRVLSFYEPVPDKMLPNDDLDLQVIDLELIRRYGLPVNRFHLSQLWEHLQDGGPDEYGAARWNVALGRYAPLCGFYCNKFYAGMGAAIRSELWACLAPGNPELAVRLAREDACTDHYADGMEACVFLSAVESAAFAESDMTKLIETGLSYINPDGRLARGLRDSVRYINLTGDPYKARELFLHDYYVQNWTDVTINLGLILISWIASKGDFSRAICIAGGLGYDADCTCATLGSILGIIDPGAIGSEWTAPIGDRLFLSCSIMGIHEPETIGEFCDIVAATADEVMSYYGFGHFENFSSEVSKMHRPWTEDVHCADWYTSPKEAYNSSNEALISLTPITARLIYPKYVAVKPDERSEFTLKLRNPAKQPLSGSFTLSLPDGWTVSPDSFGFSLEPGTTYTFDFAVTPAVMEKRRARDNDLDIDFVCGGLAWKVTADLPVAIPWLRENLDTGKTEQIDERQIFGALPAGRWRYRTAVKVNPYMPVRFGVMSNRSFHARFNGKEVLSGDGSFYVPAFHRGKTVADIRTDKLDGCWNYVEILFDGDSDACRPGEFFFGLARPHNCCEWLIGVEYSLSPLK